MKKKKEKIMKVVVIQAHKIPVEKDGELRWIDHPVGEEIEIEEKDFAPNLHKKVDEGE